VNFLSFRWLLQCSWVAILFLAAAWAITNSTASATIDGVTTVLVPRNVLDTRAGGGSLADSVGTLTAVVDGQTCMSVALTGPANVNSANDKVLTIGTAGQPAPCAVAGKEITFLNGRGQRLVVKLTTTPGATLILDNLAPEPPVDPATAAPTQAPPPPRPAPPNTGSGGLAGSR
jgi:hypothetical protein